MEHVSAKTAAESLISLATGAKLVEQLIQPTVAIPQTEPQGGEAPLDEEEGPADHPVEEETVRAPRSTSFRVAIEGPKVVLDERWLTDIKAQANVIASESSAEARLCMRGETQVDFFPAADYC